MLRSSTRKRSLADFRKLILRTGLINFTFAANLHQIFRFAGKWVAFFVHEESIARKRLGCGKCAEGGCLIAGFRNS